jgi:hypothetical protein
LTDILFGRFIETGIHIFPDTQLLIVRAVDLLCLVLPLCLIFVVPGLSSADRAGIPIDPHVEFDESAQNAIVAWNGTDEVLMLSTDLRSGTPGRLLEMLPLPSSPYDIKQGNISSFKKMIGLFNEKSERLQASNSESNDRATGLGGMEAAQYSGISVTFSASIGAHDLTVVHVENQTHFSDWVRDFAAGMGVSNFTTAQELNGSVGSHLERGISYFVFDAVDLAGDLKTLDPMVYKFRTDFLYYPLDITGATLPHSSWADHKIRVFLVMDGILKNPYSGSLGNLTHGAGFYEYIQFSQSELGQVSGDISAIFPRDAFVGYAFDSEFGSRDRTLGDVIIRPGDIRRPTTDELNRQEFKIDIRPLSPSLAYYLLLSTVEPSSGPVEWMMGAMVAGLLFSPFVLGFIFSSIIGDRHFAMMLILLIPLGVALTISGLVSRNRIVYTKKRMRALAYGMGTAQSLALLFLPNGTAAIISGVFCFPSMLILGMIILVAVLAMRLVRTNRDRPTAPSPP